MNQESHATIRLERKTDPFTWLYRMALYVDNVLAGKINMGETIDYPTMPGQHTVYVKLNFWKSNPLTLNIADGETINLGCDSRANSMQEMFSLHVPLHLYLENPLAKQPVEPTHDITVSTQLNPDAEKIVAATEQVHAPAGVSVKVKRSRTVEHTLTMGWSTSGEVQMSAGVEKLIGLSIRAQIEKQLGWSDKQSETIEYEVTLDGNKSNTYDLLWQDIWRNGTATWKQDGNSYGVPFRYRERTELEVIPKSNTTK